MGLASVARAERAAAMRFGRVAAVRGWLARACSVAVQRAGVSRRLAAPIRISEMVELSMRATAAIATLEMAWAFRVPTLRM